MNNYPIHTALLNRLILTISFATILFTVVVGCGETEETTDSKIIREITAVQISVLEGQPQQLEISVAGNVPNPGWTSPELVAVEYDTPPADGIYEFSFYATPPEKEPDTSEATPIDVTHRLDPLPEDLKGVRIYAETNDMVVMLEAPNPAPVPAIISEVTDAKLTLIDNQAGHIEIFAKGNVSSAGWSNPTLIATEYIAPPQDGIYDFTFYATPPEEASAPVITPIEVTHSLNAIPENITGVRIHSQTNEIVVLLDSPKPPPSPVAINEITAVSLSILKTLPPQLAISVTGTVDSTGWTQPTLVPRENQIRPQDGIYEFTFMATPPVEPGQPEVTPIELMYTLEPIPDDLLGVRIYSSNNNVEAMLVIEVPNPGPAIINEVTDVQLSVLESLPLQLNINATGNVTSSGWSSPILVPFQYIQPPQDGIYDFSFFATPPVEPGDMVITPIEVTHRLNAISENLNGVRIHSETNSITVMLDVPQPPPVPNVIYSIENVQLISDTSNPGQLDIQVEGTVNSGGWSRPMLIAHEYIVPPQDGIYDFTFYATPPADPAIGVMTPIDVVHRLNPVPADMKGVRIHASTNNMETLLDPSQSACDFVNNKVFETAELYDGGAAPPTVDTRFHWRISFTDGSFLHLYTDVAEMGTYYCDNTGFHLLNSNGGPYVPWEVSVDIENQSVNIPVSEIEPRYYYLLDPNQVQ